MRPARSATCRWPGPTCAIRRAVVGGRWMLPGSAAGVVDTARRQGMEPPLTAKKVFAEARKGDRKALKVVTMEAGTDRPGDRGSRGGRRPGTRDPGRGHRRERRPAAGTRGAAGGGALAVPASDRGLDASRGSHAARLGFDGAAGGAGPTVRPREGAGVNPEHRPATYVRNDGMTEMIRALLGEGGAR